MSHQTTPYNKAEKPELRYLEDFLQRAGKPAYILSVLRANIPDSIISQLEAKYQQDDAVIGVTGLIDTVVIVFNSHEKVAPISKSKFLHEKVAPISKFLSSTTEKYVGILEYRKECDVTRLYSDIFKAASLAEDESKERLYDPEKDSLESMIMHNIE